MININLWYRIFDVDAVILVININLWYRIFDVDAVFLVIKDILPKMKFLVLCSAFKLLKYNIYAGGLLSSFSGM